jgi:hypothetical protein
LEGTTHAPVVQARNISNAMVLRHDPQGIYILSNKCRDKKS